MRADFELPGEKPRAARRVRRAAGLVWSPLNPRALVALKLGCGKARGGRIPRSGAVTDEQRSHSPISAQPRRAAAPFPAAFLAHSLQIFQDMFVVRASSA